MRTHTQKTHTHRHTHLHTPTHTYTYRDAYACACVLYSNVSCVRGSGPGGQLPAGPRLVWTEHWLQEEGLRPGRWHAEVPVAGCLPSTRGTHAGMRTHTCGLSLQPSLSWGKG